MKSFSTVDDILDFAINAEQEAVDFYTYLAKTVKGEEMKKVFVEFAQEEMKHKARLTGIKENHSYEMPLKKIRDLKISDYLTDVNPSPDMSYQEALILAMKKEKNAFRLYLMLSEETNDPAMKNLFLSLAQEESKHKLRFELEYDDYILREN
ncbi:MAG TPA: ferritin family protein [Bacteroidales bacterium]|nr:ferritin family protein [Bacteroidales bacterium]